MIKGNRDLYEFDLKGFFNQVKIKWIYSHLTTYSRLLAFLVYKIVTEIKYVVDGGWENLKESDTELLKKGQYYQG